MYSRYSLRWFTLAVFCLGLGGGFAFLVAMSRAPFAEAYFPADFFYHALVGHVVLAILLWLSSFTIVLWTLYFKGKEWNLTCLISLIGVFLVTISVITGRGMAIPNNYVPSLVDPIFFSGLVLFFAGFSINALSYLQKGLRNLFSSDSFISTLSTSVIVAVILMGAMLFSLATNSMNGEKPLIFYERLFWTPGHIQQVLNGTLLVSVWYALQRMVGVNRNWHFLTFVNCIFLLSALALFIISLFYDPISRGSKIAAEVIYATGLGVPIFLHAANIMKGLKKDLKSVSSISLLLSMAIYFFGIAIAYSGFGNDLRVPAHYHGAVTSLTLALMGLSYYLIKRGFKKKVYGGRIAKIQPIIYGVGMILFIFGLFVSGLFGAPRKTHGIAFATDPVVLSALTIMGIGTLLAVAGGVIFVFYTSMTLILNRENDV
jgi:cytochrome c oxidase subunit 1